MILNLVSAPRPLYRVEDWLETYVDGLAEEHVEAAKYNDDRLARSLDALFNGDRGSMMAEASQRALAVHELETDRIHNDTTSITFAGAYEREDPRTVKLRTGFNKDHRPDCKQVVFGLNTTGDGHVPVSFRVYDGNQADVATHRANWDGLRALLGKEDFLYVADSKLCSLDTLGHLAQYGGTS